MKRVKNDFDKRKTELNEYFNFLSKLDKEIPTLHYSEVGVNETKNYTYTVNNELQKILIANGFLLIYNLVESFCRNFILDILTAIQGKKLTLKRLSEETQKIWIAHKVKNYKDPRISNEKLEDCFYGMANVIFNSTIIEFSEMIRKIETEEKYDPFGLSGSITQSKIKSLARMYGFESLTPPRKEKAGESLEVVKTFRNQLAHGRITFADCGKDKSVTQMIDYKNNTVEYLESVLVNIEDYLENTKFKK